MKKFEILAKLLKCDIELQTEQMLFAKITFIELLNSELLQTFSL